MKKGFVTIGIAAGLTIAMSMTAFAGWDQMGAAWKYQNTDGVYLANTWAWIDGNNDGIAESYCFDGNGNLYVNVRTPDQYVVNENGAWTVNGVVQTMVVGNIQADPKQTQTDSTQAQVEQTKPAPTDTKVIETKPAQTKAQSTPKQETQPAPVEQTQPAPTQAPQADPNDGFAQHIDEIKAKQDEALIDQVTAPGGDSYDYSEPLQGIEWN